MKKKSGVWPVSRFNGNYVAKMTSRPTSLNSASIALGSRVVEEKVIRILLRLQISHGVLTSGLGYNCIKGT